MVVMYGTGAAHLEMPCPVCGMPAGMCTCPPRVMPEPMTPEQVKEFLTAPVATEPEDPLIACARELQAKRKEWLDTNDRARRMKAKAHTAFAAAQDEYQRVEQEADAIDAEVTELRKKLHQLSGGK